MASEVRFIQLHGHACFSAAAPSPPLPCAESTTSEVAASAASPSTMEGFRPWFSLREGFPWCELCWKYVGPKHLNSKEHKKRTAYPDHYLDMTYNGSFAGGAAGSSADMPMPAASAAMQAAAHPPWLVPQAATTQAAVHPSRLAALASTQAASAALHDNLQPSGATARPAASSTAQAASAVVQASMEPSGATAGTSSTAGTSRSPWAPQAV